MSKIKKGDFVTVSGGYCFPYCDGMFTILEVPHLVDYYDRSFPKEDEKHIVLGIAYHPTLPKVDTAVVRNVQSGLCYVVLVEHLNLWVESDFEVILC